MQASLDTQREGTMQIVSVNISGEKGTVERSVPETVIDALGLAGDAHAGDWMRQVSLLGTEAVGRLSAEILRPIGPGAFGENLTVAGLDAASVGILDRFRTGTVELEVTQIGKECHGDGCAIFRESGRCVMPVEGIFCRVLAGGLVKPGDALEHAPHLLRARVITLSDRAYAGVYEDRSGPRLATLLTEFLASRRFHESVERILLPDDPISLRVALEAARTERLDLVFTTGGTGIGPRDHAPEVVAAVCSRLIPGIMESIRARHGVEHPAALLSRAVAGVAGTTLVFTLPGSVRAVEEYADEIFRVLEHAILMVRGMGH
jgi:molybdenum cofactor synthesis domain-containing protein